MANLTFNGEVYVVDHATKGADYIHGYDANGQMILCFDGIIDFSAFTYDGTYMEPASCFEEICNAVRIFEGNLVRSDGTVIAANEATGEATGTSSAITLTVPNFTLVDGAKVRFKIPVNTAEGPTLNVNGTGAYVIRHADGTKLKLGQQAGVWMSVTYSAALGSFISGIKGGDDGATWKGTLYGRGPTVEGILGLHIYKTRSV